MIKLKQGVSLRGLQPQAALAMHVVDAVYARHGVDLVITSGTDGKHGRSSKHYTGCAFDGRTHDLVSASVDVWVEIVEVLRDALGQDYDVIYEAAGSPNAHLHVEWDPK